MKDRAGRRAPPPRIRFLAEFGLPQTETLQLVMLDEGDIFGEIAFLEKNRRTATVKAAEETRVLELDAADALTQMRAWAQTPLPLTGACHVVSTGWPAKVLSSTRRITKSCRTTGKDRPYEAVAGTYRHPQDGDHCHTKCITREQKTAGKA